MRKLKQQWNVSKYQDPEIKAILAANVGNWANRNEGYQVPSGKLT